MSKLKTNWIIIVNSLLLISMTTAMIFCLKNVEWYGQAIFYGCIFIFGIGSIVFHCLKKTSLSRSLFLLNIVVFLIIGSLTVMNLCGIFNNFKDMSKIKELILSCGNWGYVIYALLQILNIIILPLPGFVFIVIGMSIFGPMNTFIVTYISTLIGAIAAFMIGRVFGQKAVVWCVGQESTDKYKKMIGAKGNVLFVMMQILPFFPDDILGMVAGLTSMKFSFFTISMILIKPIYIAFVCFLGTGSIIPFSGWGIPVWIAIFAVFALVFILFCKYQAQIENWFRKIGKKNGKKAKPENEHSDDIQ